MSQYRTPTERSKLYIPKEVYLTTLHYCRQYPLWEAELQTEPDTSKAITYDKERVQTSNQFDATAEIAMHRMDIANKKAKVDDTSNAVAGDLAKWLRLGVCYGLTYPDLEARGIPCGRATYFRMKRQFYYLLSNRI